MNSDQLRQLLEKVKSGNIDVNEALDQLRFMPYEDIGFAKLDHHRSLRRGFAEVILCKGKTPDQVAGIAKRMASAGTTLATKAGPEMFEAVRQVAPNARYYQLAGLIVIGDPPPVVAEGYVLVVTAGTGDIPVAEEAAVTA